MIVATGDTVTVDDWTVDADALVLIGCSSRKLDHAAPARDLYTGELFRLSVRWAESWGLSWRVLSALHGVVDPDRVIEPYDYRLGAAEADRRRLAQMIGPVLHHRGLPSSLVVLAGADYVECVRRSTVSNLPTWTPLQECFPRGLGHYKSWLRRNASPVVAVAE